MSYNRINWTGAIPIDPSNLNIMDLGIERTHALSMTTATRDALAGGDLFTGRVIFNTTVGRAQWYDGTNWWEAAGGGTAPSNVTKAAAAEGTSRALARADHKHDVTTGAPSNIGTANAEGSGTNLARRTHVHNGAHLLGAALHSADTLANLSAKISDGTIVLASQAEAEAGSENTKRMTPLRVQQLVGASTTFAKIATGTYTGDDSTDQGISGLGFQPKLVWITLRVTTDGTSLGVKDQVWTSDVIIDDNAAGQVVRIDASSVAFQHNAIITLDADGFSVDDAGGNQDPNASGVVYNYWAIG